MLLSLVKVQYCSKRNYYITIPVAFASRAMTPAEQHYSQIEKEALAILFGCKKFEHYIYLKKVNIQSDHKPLEVIFKKAMSKAPKRLQRIMLQLQHFDLNITYMQGKKIVLADALSRDYENVTKDYECLKEEIWTLNEMRNQLAMQPTTIEKVETESK